MLKLIDFLSIGIRVILKITVKLIVSLTFFNLVGLGMFFLSLILWDKYYLDTAIKIQDRIWN